MDKAIVNNPDSPANGKEVFIVRRIDFLRYLVSFTEEGKTYTMLSIHLIKKV
jgi:hypothetical protein